LVLLRTDNLLLFSFSVTAAVPSGISNTRFREIPMRTKIHFVLNYTAARESFKVGTNT